MVIRVQHVPAQFAAGAEAAQQGTIGTDTSRINEPTSKVHQGTVRMTAGGEVEQPGPARHVVSFDGAPGGSVLATRQRVNGHDTVEIVPGQPGTRTLLRTALQDGLIRETAPGIYEDAKGTDGEQRTAADGLAEQQAGQEKQSAEQAQYVDSDEETAWASDIEPLPQHAYDAASASAIGAVLRGDNFEDAAKSLAHSAGIAPELAADYVEQGFAKARRMVDRALAPLGLNGERLEQFYEAARQSPQELQDAMQRAWWTNDASGFKAMAVRWKVQNPGDLSVYRQAGFEVHVDRDSGDVMLKRESGGWVKAADLGK
jgi:hypothetical protein